MTEKELESIKELTYPDGTSISGKDQQRVFNLVTIVGKSIPQAWVEITLSDKMREQEEEAAKICSIDNKDDCEACGS